MSIVDEITRIKNCVKSAYTNCRNKGATLPAIQNITNLPDTISAISGSVNSKYGLVMDNILGNVNANGELQPPISGELIANGIKKIDNAALAYKFCNYIDNDYYYEEYEIFINRNVGIESILFPDLEYIGNYAMAYFINYAPDLTSAEFPKLEEIGNNGLTNAFSYNSNLVNISFPKLKKIGMNGLSSCFYNTKVSIVNFPDLEEVYSGGLSGAFSVCGITSVSMPKLRTAKGSAFSSCFSSVRLLESISFPSLVNINEQYVFHYAFQNCSKMKNIYFPALTPESFGSYKNQFNYMLSGVSGCTVHFPSRIKKTIVNWSDVVAGFGGYNTIILFDLSAATVNFTSNSNNYSLYIDKDLIEDSSILLPAEDIEYLAHDTNANKVLVQTLTNLVENETKNEFIDFNQNSKKVKITTNHGANVYFDILGVQICAVEESNGNFAINYIGNNIDISYFIDGGDNYTDASGTISVQNNNVSQNITLSSATISNFSRPNLSANGTMGGNSFAVSCDSAVSSGYQPYYAVNGNTDYLWMVNNTNSTCKYTFYNPIPLKVSQIINYYTSTTYSASNFIIEGSNDNQNWTEIGTYTVSKTLTQTIPVNSTRYFKYHRITYKNSTIRLKDLGITATQKG